MGIPSLLYIISSQKTLLDFWDTSLVTLLVTEKTVDVLMAVLGYLTRDLSVVTSIRSMFFDLIIPYSFFVLIVVNENEITLDDLSLLLFSLPRRLK